MLTPLAFALGAGSTETVYSTKTGIHIGGKTTDRIGDHGVTAVAQRAGAAQDALVDTALAATAASTFSANTATKTLAIPIQLSSMTSSAADLITNYTPGYAFKILSVSFATTTIGTGIGASQTLNLEIGTTNLTGGVLTVGLTETNTLGKLTAATAVTAANVGTATDTLSLEVAAGGTSFTAGTGVLFVTIQNMDEANTLAGISRLLNELRAALVARGTIKGGS